LNPIKALPLFLVAALGMRQRTPRRPLGALLIGSFAGFVMLVLAYPNATLLDESRYHFGFTFAAILAIGLHASEVASRRSPTARSRAELAVGVPLVIAAFGLQISDDRPARSTRTRRCSL
jgi:hypothetical protein